MTTPPSGWPPPYHPSPQGSPIPPGPPPSQGVGAYPPPQGDPNYALVSGPGHPPPQANPAHPVATGRPAEGWLPPPLGGSSTTWAPPGWPPPPTLPPPGPMPAPGTLDFPAPSHPPTFPSAPAPRRPAWLVVTLVVGVLAVIGVSVVLLAQQWNPDPSVAGQPTVEVTGGDIGTPVELTGPDGSGRVTVTGARWTSEGEVAPVPGTSYLVVDVRLEGVTGEFTTGAVFTAVVAADGQRHGISYGPVLDPLLTSRTLRSGEVNAGHLGYQLAPGPVRLEFQTPQGVLLGAVQIPGP